MVRIAYEGNMLIIIHEGLKRNSHYYYEANQCTLNTENTISSIVQKYLNECNLYDKRTWHE